MTTKRAGKIKYSLQNVINELVSVVTWKNERPHRRGFLHPFSNVRSCDSTAQQRELNISQTVRTTKKQTSHICDDLNIFKQKNLQNNLVKDLKASHVSRRLTDTAVSDWSVMRMRHVAYFECT